MLSWPTVVLTQSVRTGEFVEMMTTIRIGIAPVREKSCLQIIAACHDCPTTYRLVTKRSQYHGCSSSAGRHRRIWFVGTVPGGENPKRAQHRNSVGMESVTEQNPPDLAGVGGSCGFRLPPRGPHCRSGSSGHHKVGRSFEISFEFGGY